MESVILKTLGNVDGLDAGRFTKRPSIKNKFVRTSAILVDVKYLVVRLETRENVVGVQQRNLGSVCESIRAWCES